jgi:hypothetical protein
MHVYTLCIGSCARVEISQEAVWITPERPVDNCRIIVEACVKTVDNCRKTVDNFDFQVEYFNYACLPLTVKKIFYCIAAANWPDLD